MSLRRNFSVGLLSSIWSALLGLAVVPIYIKYLGIEAYGLIGFFATTQALLQLLDLGVIPTVNREMARCSALGNVSEAKNLLHTFAVVSWSMAALIAVGIAVLSPFVAAYWLQAKELPQAAVGHALMLMGLVVASRWPVGLYMGAMMGLQRVALSSTIGAIFSTLSSLGAVGVLAFVSPTIEAFFIWQACVGMAYAISMRWTAWRLMKREGGASRFSLDELKRVWRFSAGMSGIAISGVILMQLDKVLLSRLLNLDDFGKYVLAGVVANGLYILLTPLFNAIYPRMTAMVASGETQKLEKLYRTGTRLFLAALFPIAIMVAVFSKELLYLWTRNAALANSSALVVSLCLMGTALNGVMHFPYALQLAYGNTQLPLRINAILIAVMIPMTIVLALSYGAAGGAGAWALLNTIYLVVGTWLTHRVLLKGIGARWLFGDVMLPLGVAVAAGVIGKLIHSYRFPVVVDFLSGALLVLLAFAVVVLVSPGLRELMRNLQTEGWLRMKAN